jgi:hypothetical protein
MQKSLFYVTMGVFIFIVFSTAFAIADPGVPAVNETQGLTIGTSISTQGIVTDQRNLAWQITTGILDSTLSTLQPATLLDNGMTLYWQDNPFMDALLGHSSGETQYTTGYSSSTTANDGISTINGEFSVGTGNTIAGASNVQSTRSIQYESVNGAQLSSAENILLDGAGQTNLASGQFLCPFSATSDEFTPPFCNIVESGSDLLISKGSLVTDANNRFVSATSDYPVDLGYSISLTGIGDQPATGSVSEYLNTHIQEGHANLTLPIVDLGPGGGEVLFFTSSKSEDLTYQHNSAATGLITAFKATSNWQSGKNLI